MEALSVILFLFVLPLGFLAGMVFVAWRFSEWWREKEIELAMREDLKRAAIEQRVARKLVDKYDRKYNS
jgi:hypothetical protein